MHARCMLGSKHLITGLRLLLRTVLIVRIEFSKLVGAGSILRLLYGVVHASRNFEGRERVLIAAVTWSSNY